MKKKLLALLLALASVVSLLTFPASAAEIVYSGTCGEDLTWTLDSNGQLVISGTGDIEDYESRAPWRRDEILENHVYVRDLIIEPGVTSIGDRAFYSCESLNHADLPNTITRIGEAAFFFVHHLHMEIPDSVTVIEDNAFSWCGLDDVVKLPAELVSIGKGAFSFTYITTFIVPDSLVTVGESAFRACPNLSDVYYTGTEAQWHNIDVGANNEFLQDATIHYNYHPASLAAQPLDYTGLVNSLARFTIAASGDGLKYQWQYSDDNGATWLDSSLKSATYSAKLTAEKDGRMVRCIVTDAAGYSVTSDPAVMRISNLKITTQPKDYIGAVNSTAKFTLAASGEGLKYQWQYSDDNGATWLASTIQKATYSAKLTADKDGRMVRCIVTDQHGVSVTSSAAKMALAGPVITIQPKDYVGAVNSTAKFSVAASGDGLKYQWQYSDDNGATWLASSIKSATYSAKFTSEKNNRMVRCIVTDASGNSVTSNAAKMTLSGPVITSQPQNYVGAVNSTAKFTVTATGNGLTYQWQYSDDNGATWLASSLKSATYSAKFTAEKNNRMVRCIVTNADGNSVTSNAVSMRIG